ncbi:MAG: toxic anion resistance protein [Culturomica sp.]|jgi:uncharacterized protein YaaN involved in tellurite resistance|nr:toxic anion resistance protein [Culturomica sp.]
MDEELLTNAEQPVSESERIKIEDYKNKIDFTRSDQIIQYGIAVQNRLTDFADTVLSNVRTKDMGEVGNILATLTVDLKKFDTVASKKIRLTGIFSNLKRRIAQLKAEFARVEQNIHKIELQLEQHNQTLMKDIYIFDEQYRENWKYFREITLYIQAGEEKIKDVRENILSIVPDRVEDGESIQDKQKHKDLEQQVHRFEKKIHDLKLSRMVSIQLAPQIRMIQNNSATMIEKIQSTIANTLPLWKNQMVLSLGILHSQQALNAQKNVVDTTNELLKKNSETLKQSTTQISVENERGIIDIETIRKANTDLLTTMDDICRIQKEGREKRIAVEIELKAAEEELKAKLSQLQK